MSITVGYISQTGSDHRFWTRNFYSFWFTVRPPNPLALSRPCGRRIHLALSPLSLISLPALSLFSLIFLRSSDHLLQISPNLLSKSTSWRRHEAAVGVDERSGSRRGFLLLALASGSTRRPARVSSSWRPARVRLGRPAQARAGGRPRAARVDPPPGALSPLSHSFSSDLFLGICLLEFPI